MKLSITAKAPSKDVEAIVKQYVRSRRHLRDKLGSLAMFWPPSKGVMEQLAQYVGDGLMRQDMPLLYLVLDRAVDAFFSMPPRPRRQRYATFVNKCTEESVVALSTVTVVQERRRWHIADGEPMLGWYWSAPGELRVEPHQSAEAQRRAAMSAIQRFLVDENRFVLSGNLRDLGLG